MNSFTYVRRYLTILFLALCHSEFALADPFWGTTGKAFYIAYCPGSAEHGVFCPAVEEANELCEEWNSKCYADGKICNDECAGSVPVGSFTSNEACSQALDLLKTTYRDTLLRESRSVWSPARDYLAAICRRKPGKYVDGKIISKDDQSYDEFSCEYDSGDKRYRIEGPFSYRRFQERLLSFHVFSASTDNLEAYCETSNSVGKDSLRY